MDLFPGLSGLLTKTLEFQQEVCRQLTEAVVAIDRLASNVDALLTYLRKRDAA